MVLVLASLEFFEGFGILAVFPSVHGFAPPSLAHAAGVASVNGSLGEERSSAEMPFALINESS